jgi:hypothetical protein
VPRRYHVFIAKDNHALPDSPLVIVDVSAIHEHRPALIEGRTAPTTRRRRSIVENVVRLIPGRTRLPFADATV